ncbi:proteasome activator complex subunit 4A-like isoform X2 [Lycorma delicatula]|uniref:proteasome activator complex subunit 4A-like isoform X2 n=1 Tax=Lycorma delicatula TaxID=130591 RepID=UPI003F51960C
METESDDWSNKRFEKLGFKPQKEDVYNKLLPYSERLDDDSVNMLKEVKGHLGKLIILREMRPGCGMWVVKLQRYIRLYGLKFSKEDHLLFINLTFEALTIPSLEPYLVNKFASLLILLLKKKELISPEELTLPWRPLYELRKKITTYNQTSLGMYRYISSLETTLDRLVHEARYYFSPTSTQEILDEFRPMLCPFDNSMMCNGIACLEWFLPLAIPPDQTHIGYKLWFDELMNLWKICHNAPSWEKEIMWLMTRLAHCNIGYIDWEPHMSLMFTRFLRSMNLPVTYKQVNIMKLSKIETTSIAMWIVATLGGGSSTQDHLDKFMKTVESYFYPANFGRWLGRLKDLLRKLPYYFINRLHRERFKKRSWETPVPEDKKLTEEDITRFVECLKPSVMTAIFSKLGGADVAQAMNQLATLRPKLMIPPAIETMYTALDTLTEPHRYTAAMHCVAAVSRPMVEGNDYPEGPNHVIPLLFAILPGIDPNDFHKCFVTFQFITSFSVMISFVDCSKASEHWNDLTPEEEVTCSATAQMEDFLLQFLDRCFLLIESSSLENTRLEQDSDKRSKLENIAEGAIASTCFSILNQTSLAIFNTAVQKLYSFVTNRILETKVAGRFIATMCGAFCRVRPDVTLKLFLPHMCENVFSLTDSIDILKEEILDNELLYNLLILTELLNCHGAKVTPYLPYLEKVLDRTLHAKCKECNLYTSNILAYIFLSICAISPTEYCISSAGTDAPISEHLPIRAWGKSGDIHNLNISWHFPDEYDLNEVQRLISKYLPPELERLEKYVKNEITLTREELQCSLSIVMAVLNCGHLLPDWDEPPISLIESYQPPLHSSVTLGIIGKLTMPDGSNVRKTVVFAISSLQEKLMSCAEDDTKSFFSIINIWELLLLYTCKSRDEYDLYWKNFLITKKFLENRLVKGKKHLRALLIERAKLQHSKRKAYGSNLVTETHRLIFDNLLTLATSHYSEVRARAQSKLFVAVDHYPYSYKLLVPKLVENLQKDSNKHHELFKGSLYVLLGPKSNPIISRHDWKMLLSLWPVIVKATPSEKLSVIKLLDAITEAVHKHFPTITISLTIPQPFVDMAKHLWTTVPAPSLELPSEEEEKSGLIKHNVKSEENLNCYLDLLSRINDAIEQKNLHWRYHTMALCFLRDLVHPDVAYPPPVVNNFLYTLIHDSLDLRKIAIRCTVYALKQQKRPHKKYEIAVDKMVEMKNNEINISAAQCVGDGYLCDEHGSVINNKGFGDRSDNKWLHYNYATRPLSKEQWDKPYFQHKRYIGYYTWPKVMQTYAASSEQPPLDRRRIELTDEEKQVYDFFVQHSNVEKFIKFLSLEEKKGRDKFNGFRFILFKSIFRNHGDTFLELFKPHIKRLVEDKQESSQRCVAEIISGLVRGSKHWPFDKVEKLWDFLIPIIQKALSNMTEETVVDWGICFATSAEGRDPNRHHWMLEVLMEEPLRDESSFRDSGRLYALQGALNQQEWRVAELFHRLLNYLEPHINHPFQNVRDRLGSMLTNIFEMDLCVNGEGGKTRSPKIKDFVESILPRLNILYTVSLESTSNSPENSLGSASNKNNIVINENVEGVEREAAIRLLKTVIKWIVASLCRAQYSSIPEFLSFLPLVCLMERYENDIEVSAVCSSFLSAMSQSLALEECMPYALDAVFKTSEYSSWWARETCLEFLQVFIFHNMAILVSKSVWVSKITDLVLQLMIDEKPEVREKASQVLAGLIHCEIISTVKQEQMLKVFKKQCKTKVKLEKKQVVNGLAVRHAGVLGLCAFINASPYDVPDTVPQIFLYLGLHLNDPQPIPNTIWKTLGDFKRTHQDNWVQHKLKFTEEQLSVLSDLIVPPSYYA